MTKSSVAAALVFVVSSLAGCCYTIGVVPPDGVKRVFIPIFKNDTFPYERGLEDELTLALREELEIQTSCILAPTAASADAVIEGTISRFRERVRAEDRLDRAVRSSATVAVEVVFRRTGERPEIFFKDNISERVAFRTSAGVDNAKKEMVRRVTDKIIARMTRWD